MSCGCSSCVDAVFPCGCGNSSCNSCSTTNCDQIIYTGPKLTCSGIDTKDNICVALQKLDYAVCNPPGATVTASNGLYKDLFVNDIRLGGPLTEATVIGASLANTLSITGLNNDPVPNFIVSQTNIGVLRKTSTSDLINLILSSIGVNNGLTLNGNTIQLGGSLVQPTTIVANSTNTLSLLGLVSNPSPSDILSIDPITGLLTTTSLSAIIPPAITADNGLTLTGSNVQLGGTLIKNTTVDLAGYNFGLLDSSSPKSSTITLEGDRLTSTLNYVDLGYLNTVDQKYGVALGHSNEIANAMFLYSFAAGISNYVEGNSSYAIGESNEVTSSCSGAIGCNSIVDGYLCHAIGYDLDILSEQTGLLQAGIFNDVTSEDYTSNLGLSTALAFSVGSGRQSGENPADKMNAFHVFRSGNVKSKDGYDARSGQRGMIPPQWSNTGWERSAPLGGDFVAGKKYIITTYVTGNDFSNVAAGGTLLWGSMNQTGCVFVAGVSGSATNWTTSTVIEVGRPTDPVLGEMGFNLDVNCLEYWNGSQWCQLCCGL